MFRLVVLGLLVLASLSWADARAQQAAPPAPPLAEWQVLETSTGRPLRLDDWLPALAAHDVIYVGEEHHNRSHVLAAVRILEGLVLQGRRPAVAMEMFSWDVQPAIDRYLAGQSSLDGFLHGVQWEQTWGGDYGDYAPLLDFARSHGLEVLALNPPRSLVRRVVAVGLAETLREPQTTNWGMNEEIPEDQPYVEMLAKQIERCHPGLSERGYHRMLEASQFRDEAMAKTIVEFLRRRRPEQGPLVSYTGGGHIQYQLPVPKRVLRRNGPTRQATVYLTPLQPGPEDEVAGLLQERIADYLWLTPLSAHGAPQRCG